MKKTLPVGIQVYSVREEAAKDFKGTMTKLKELGYDFVELAGLYGQTPEEVKAILDEVGIPAISAHVSELMTADDYESVLDGYVTIGCKYVAIPWLGEGMRPGDEGFDKVLARIDAVGAAAEKRGLVLLYHNPRFRVQKDARRRIRH